MPDQEGSQPGSYQFKEYMHSTPPAGQAQNAPLAGSIQPPAHPPVQGQPAPYPPPFPYPPTGPGYPAGYYPAPPAQAVPRQKKMLYFPLTRHASPGKQAISMAIYSLSMLALSIGSIFSINLLSASLEPDNPFVHADGTVNGLLILIFLLFLLLVVPAITLLSGALFGAVRALLVTCIVAGGTAALLLVYAFAQHTSLSLNNANGPATAVLVLSPITASLVGFIYDRRRYAAWWKSFLSLSAGSAFFVTILLTLTAILGRPADGSSQTALADLYVGIACIWLLLMPLMALPVAGIEGILHAILVARHKNAGLN